MELDFREYSKIVIETENGEHISYGYERGKPDPAGHDFYDAAAHGPYGQA